MANEKRLLDANALLRHKRKMSGADFGGEFWDEAVLTSDIKNAPTVNAVEVVRCKDCKHYRPQKKSAHGENRANYCNRIVTIKVRPYDFCSYGERKDGAD